MAFILSIETSTQVCSVAIHEDGDLKVALETNHENAHAKQLMLSIQDLLNESGLDAKDLDAFAVSTGPGSYTGLRIGVSVAKGLSYALDKPVIAIDTLQALAKQVVPFLKNQKSLIIPLIDARRMEVYMAVFDSELKFVKDIQPLILDEGAFLDELALGEVHFLGDGSEKLKGLVKHPNAYFHPFRNSAKSVGELAYEKYKQEDFADLAYLEPNYLKEFRVLASKKNPLLL